MRKKLLSMGILIILFVLLSGCSNADSYSKNGKKSFKSGNYEKAASSFATAISKNPHRGDYYVDYGLTLIALGNYEEALEQFDQVYIEKEILIIKENNKKALRGKGIAYYEMLQYEKAIEEFDQALEINELSDLDMDILYYKANTLTMIGSYEKAIDAYTSLLTLHKKNAFAYSQRALCYRYIGDYDKSLKDYDKAIKLEPKNYDYYFGKYYLLKECFDDVGAAKILEEAQELPVITNQDKYNLAKLYYLEGNYDLALTKLSEGYANGLVEAYYYIGEIYRMKKDYAKAIYYYEIYINSMDVKLRNVYNQIAICYLKTEDYDQALEYLEKGLAYNQAGTLQVLKKNEIIVYEKLGKYEEAKMKMDQYQLSFPEDSKAVREATFIETRATMPDLQ